MRRTAARFGPAALIGLLAVIAFWNAFHYDFMRGFDVEPDLVYARGLVERGELPQGTGSYYNPPGFFAVGGLALKAGESLGMDKPDQLAQLVNALLLVATAALLLALVRDVWPGRPLLHLSALAFFVACPVVLRTTAMFHPEPMSMFLSTAAMFAACRMLSRRSFDTRYVLLAGVALGLAQLTRAFALWTVATVAIAFVWFLVGNSGLRRVATRSLVVILAVAALVPAPWYIHQAVKYSNPVFAQPAPEKPIWRRRPLRFYLATGVSDVVRRPYRPAFREDFIPLVYAETWGDYFGTWAWKAASGPPNATTVRFLRVQMAAGLLPTILALAGTVGLLAFALRRPGERAERLAVALLPVAGVAGILYFAVSYPTVDGDTAKASYMLTTAPFWAVGFGVAVEALSSRRGVRIALLIVVAAAFVLSLRFLVSL